jgi:hypothetical protein
MIVRMRFFDGLLRFVREGPRAGEAQGHFEPPAVERELVKHLFRPEHGLPQVDWWEADAWREKNPGVSLRAVAGVWLDELRDALEGEHRRWRHERIEGRAPEEDGLALRAARGAERALEIVERSLRPVRGDGPVPELALIVFRDADPYYSFSAHGHAEEGEFATSGGFYQNDGGDSFPLIVTHAQSRWHLESTIAHEMTHHALYGLHLPLWLEEGFTQMMEERVTGYTDFELDLEMVERQRERWSEGLGDFWSCDAFFSPRDDDQELSYHLSEWLVRAALADQPDRFFAFVRGCARGSAEAAAVEHLGYKLEDLGRRLLGRASSEC